MKRSKRSPRSSDDLFENIGIAVIAFAAGEELDRMRAECNQRASDWVKYAIQNEVEVIDPDTGKWKVTAKDIGRMQTPMKGDIALPGEDFMLKYFPRTEYKTSKTTLNTNR